jgi:hypothetical protein
MRRKSAFYIMTPLLVGLAACTAKPPQPAAEPESIFRLTASIQDIMDSEVEPAANFLWDAVGSTTTDAVTEERQPRSEGDWKIARHNALMLIEAPNLLIMEGRRVAAWPRKLDESGTTGIATPPEIQRAIDAHRTEFIQLAHGLQDAGLQALKAVDARDPSGLMEAGAKIDEACEACHLRFWYPNSPRPPEPGANKP